MSVRNEKEGEGKKSLKSKIVLMVPSNDTVNNINKEMCINIRYRIYLKGNDSIKMKQIYVISIKKIFNSILWSRSNIHLEYSVGCICIHIESHATQYIL